MNWQALDLTIIGPALLAGLLITATHVPLGYRVLQRGIIFLDLAVAQIAGLGIILAYSLEFSPNGLQVQLIAVTAALLGVSGLYISEKLWPEIQEAIIGTLFVLASSGSILLLATSPQGGEQLKQLLVGQILWVSYEQLLPVMILYATVLVIWFAYARKASSLYFYLLFAITITASVQLIGVYLVFASLIIPALAIRKINNLKLIVGYVIGAAGYLIGLLFAAAMDLPAGAVIVFSLTVIAMLFVSGTFLFSSRSK